MPQRVKPLAVREANGRKMHRSNAELADRAEREALVGGTSDALEPPGYLTTKELRKSFRRVVSLLRGCSEQLCTDMDVDAVARYCLEEQEYLAASRALRRARDKGNADLRAISELQRLKNNAFKTVDQSARTIGLTVDARLRFDLREPEVRTNRFKESL